MNNLQFDIRVDKSTNSLFVNREFATELSLVWDAFTKQEILDQWWAPKPFTSKTITMDFKVGGRRFYKMESPGGQEHFSVQDYTLISPKTNLKYISNFADKDGNPNPQFKGSENSLIFSEANGVTTVRITIKYETLAVLEMMIEKGHKEGLTSTLEQLDKLLLAQNK